MQWVNVGDTDFAVHRDGAGSPVVMIHSLGYDSSVFDEQAAVLACKFDVIRIDLRGHGASGIGIMRPRMDQLVSDLRKVLDELGIHGAHFVGQALGGAALIGAILRGDLSGTLTLFDTIGWTDDRWADKYNTRADTIESKGMDAVAADIARASLAPSTLSHRPDVYKRYVEKLRSCSPKGYTWACRAMTAYDFRAGLKTMQLPCQILNGEYDPVATVDHGRDIQRLITNSEFRVIPRSGHLPTLENPGAATALLDTWFTTYANTVP